MQDYRLKFIPHNSLLINTITIADVFMAVYSGCIPGTSCGYFVGKPFLYVKKVCGFAPAVSTDAV